MKKTSANPIAKPASSSSRGGLAAGLPLMLLTMFTLPAAATAASVPALGTAANFAVLGASTVTNIGATIVTGDLGVSPGSAVTGFPPGAVTGSIYVGVASTAGPAQADALTAYNDAAGQVCDTNLTGVDLGGMTLTPGVYCFDTSAQLTGDLTLDFLGDSTAAFIFQTGSTLTTASNATVVAINGSPSCSNVTWQIGSSATLGSGTAFFGNILALASVTATTGVSSAGSLYALNGAVTLETNLVQACGDGGGGGGPGPFVTPFIQVLKFCDANANGLLDPQENGIGGWPIALNPDPNLCSGPTDVNGLLLCASLPIGSYSVSEGSSLSCSQTATCVGGVCGICSGSGDACGNDGNCDVGAGETCLPNPISNPVAVDLAAGQAVQIAFGNACRGAGGGRTLGFWSNKNGQKLITADALAMLRDLYLVDGNGTAFDPTTNAQVAAWLTSAKAKNMAYMLSAQLAAMQLNVFTGKVSATALVFAGLEPVGCTIPGLSATGYITIEDLMSDANDELVPPGNVTLAKNPERICQAFKQRALDAANNNRNFVVCPATF